MDRSRSSSQRQYSSRLSQMLQRQRRSRDGIKKCIQKVKEQGEKKYKYISPAYILTL